MSTHTTNKKDTRSAERILPGEFESHQHWYPKALNATIHPMISFFLNLSKERIVNRYCHLHPKVVPDTLMELLDHRCRFFPWGGADLLNVTSAGAKRQMVVIENNSCPSGQKSMPLVDDNQEKGGYKLLIERSFAYYLKGRKLPEGGLAVIYDKNPMEASGYASAMADHFDEEVFYAPFYQDDKNPPVRFTDGIMEVRDERGEWHPIRAAFRYLTQRPWNRLPLQTKTRIFNPIIACLAGGRNKMVAAKAYDLFNAELAGKGLKVNTPETIW
ncbi:MAG: hypothetical protein R3350_10790, partial [Saprospiraceae bacterium]|nr:hypothetical protein [Saprospiraceae bacterium]